MNFSIYQIYYDEISKKGLDKNFIPFLNSDPKPLMFENKIIYDLYKSKNYIDSDYCGVLSWRFKEKTGYEGKEIISILEAEKYDSYSFLPKRCEQHKHPFSRSGFGGVLTIVNEIYKAQIFQKRLLHFEPAKNIWCNYWICRPEIFEMYIENYLIPVLKHFEKKENQKFLQLYEKHRGKTNYYTSITFALEGLYSFFIENEKINHGYIPPNYK